MNKFRSFFTLLLLMIGLCLSTLQAQSYNSLWKQVEQAQRKVAANSSEIDGANLP